MNTTKTPEQIAEEAAQKVCEDNGIERSYDREPWVQALAWKLGEGLAYESGLQALVTAAIEADRAQRETATPVDPDWQDDAADMRDAHRLEIRWTAYDKRGSITFNSDDTITGAQAAAMFEAIGRTA